ncbi:MAG: trigger factor [Defluviitaleaceae bacterium]|nr:trigger factor [Defluviitaleaceae bacterium]
MSSKFEIIGDNKVKITFVISPDKFEEGIELAYKKNRGKINVDGFRKGKATRKIIEARFGKEIFYDDAINAVMPEVYEAVIDKLNLKVVSRPEIDVEEINDETGVVLTATVYTKPEVTVSGDVYKNAQYTPVSTEVTDDDIDAEILKAREQNSRMVSVERAVADGDIVTIDFEGFIDDEAFDGGKGEDHNLTIGSKSFIGDFEQQLIGANVGDDLEVNVPFPQDYHAEHLAGKPAMFKVEIKDIKVKELPELDDDFAQDVSEFDTLEAYKNSIKEKLTENKENEAKSKKEDEVLSYIIENTPMNVPEVMIENQVDQMVNDFANQIRMQGMPVEMYLQYMGQSMASLRDNYKAGAEKQVKGRLVLEAIANAEGFEVTEEDKEGEIVRIAESYNMPIDKLKEILRAQDRDGLDDDIKVNKALDFISEHAKVR